METTKLKTEIEKQLARRVVTSKILLGNCRLLDERSRETSAFSDTSYLPFYYFLGTLIQPLNVIEIGFRLGLFGSCLLKGCHSIKKYYGFQAKTEEFYSPRLGIGNIKDVNRKIDLSVYLGKVSDQAFQADRFIWDLAIINEESNYDKHIAYLDLLWKNLSDEGGLIVMDYVKSHKPAEKAFTDFCKAKNREKVVVNTRYGVGLIDR